MVFATFITLIMVPVEYVILDDIKRLFFRLIGRRPVEDPGTKPEDALEGEAV